MVNIFKVKYVLLYTIFILTTYHVLILTFLQILGISLFGASIWILFDTSTVITVLSNGKICRGFFLILLNRVTRKLEVSSDSFVYCVRKSQGSLICSLLTKKVVSTLE